MYVGIDLGGTNIAAGLVNEHGDILYQTSCPTKSERPASEIAKDMAKLVESLIKDYKISKEDVASVGIGIPGLANEDGVVIYCVNLGWTNVPLRKMLEDELHIPVFMDNDATVAGLAEYEKGSMKGCHSGILLTLGTGVGGGIILNGEVFSGFHGVGSEIGHTVVGENFYNCNCGKNGCLETFASSTAIIKYTRKLLESNKDSMIMNKAEGNIDNINAKIIFDCAKAGDEIANIAVKRFVKYLAIGIFNITNFLDPEIIALGGGVSGAGEYLLNLVIKEVENNKYYEELPSPKIVLAELGNEAGIIGAAMVGKHGILKNQK